MDSGPLTKFGILLLTFFRFGGAFASSVGYVRISRSTAADECMGYEEGALIEGSAALVEGSVARVENSVAHVEGSVARVEVSVTRVKGSVARVESSVAHVEGSVARAAGSVTRVEGSVALVVALVGLDVGSPVSPTSKGALPFVGFSGGTLGCWLAQYSFFQAEKVGLPARS